MTCVVPGLVVGNEAASHSTTWRPRKASLMTKRWIIYDFAIGMIAGFALAMLVLQMAVAASLGQDSFTSLFAFVGLGCSAIALALRLTIWRPRRS